MTKTEQPLTIRPAAVFYLFAKFKFVLLYYKINLLQFLLLFHTAYQILIIADKNTTKQREKVG